MLPNPFDDRPEGGRGKLLCLFAGLVLANAAAWLWAGLSFAGQPVLMGAAGLAYLLGLRHAFDPDHIAAIDNVVRKLRQEEKAPAATGFFFALGHSSIVILACLALAGTAAVMGPGYAPLRALGGVVGTTVSALFLLGIGLANLAVLLGIIRASRAARRGQAGAEAEIARLLAGRGLIARIFRPVFGLIGRSWHMYPVGFLFGLGFDTASEIGLLGLSAAQAAQGLPLWSILIFPALFTAGMALMDTVDSALMSGAYGWAFRDPARKLRYNLAITAASVLLAFGIGGIEALSLMGDQLGLQGALWRGADLLGADLAKAGIAMVVLCLGGWFVSARLYRRRIAARG